jgi:hypothetical protein
MPVPRLALPNSAEQVRTTCARAQGATLAVERAERAATSVHHLLEDGSFAVTLPAGSAASALVLDSATAGARAVLEFIDYAPVPLRAPVRSLVWITGRLHAVPRSEVGGLLDLIAAVDPNPALLQVDRDSVNPRCGQDLDTLVRLEIESAVLADSTGAESVGTNALLAARPDPFCVIESGWLRHIDDAHPEVIDRLAVRLPAPLRRGRIRPLGLDRYGVSLRVEHDAGDRDARLPFARPVDNVAGLSQAIRLLMGCPFLNGLRVRPARGDWLP